MKKIWQTKKWKRFQRKRANAELRKRTSRKRGRRGKHKPEDGRGEVRTFYKGEGLYLHVYAPRTLSLVANPSATVDFFSEVEARLKQGQPTFINLYDVQDVTADALMYLLALLDLANTTSPSRPLVRGNVPRGGQSRKVMLESGFSQYVAGLPKSGFDNPDIIKIRFGTMVQPDIAHELLHFAMAKLSLSRSPQTKAAFAILIESMSNVVEHAYAPTVAFERKWWSMAQVLPGQKTVRMTVVDYGEGIAATMRKTALERAGSHLGIKPDHELVLSALKGEFRSRTGLETRGRGLPKMLQENEKGNISNLVVVSSRAVVNGTESEPLEKPLQGTVISFCLGVE